jgi:hypothetical protein
MVARHQTLIDEVLREAQDNAPRRTISLSRPRGDQVLDFSDPRTAWNVIGEGWSHQADGAVWSSGVDSSLTFTIPELRERLREISLVVAPPGWRIGRLVELRIDGVPVARKRFWWRGPIVWSVPVGRPAGSTFSLSFHVLSGGLTRPEIGKGRVSGPGVGLRLVHFDAPPAEPGTAYLNRFAFADRSHA